MILPLMAVTLTAAAFAKGPVGDWQTVQQDIPRGWQITVVTAFTFPCIFEQANEQELVCARARICSLALLVAALQEFYWARCSSLMQRGRQRSF
jgi:hypothetical protein